MGQQEVYSFLSKNKNKWFTINEIEALNKNLHKRNIREAVNRMEKFGEIKLKIFKRFDPEKRGIHRHMVIKVKYNG